MKLKFLNWNLYKKNIFLRVDLNFNFHNKNNFNFKFYSLKDTLLYLLSQNSKIILATHADTKLSLDSLFHYFKDNLGIPIYFFQGFKFLDISKKIANLPFPSIILLDNLRKNSCEIYNCYIFAKKLRILADYYINDAFGAMHRRHSSLYQLPKLYSKDRISIGFLVYKELENINKFISFSKNHKTLFILSGNKISTKLPLVFNLLKKNFYVYLAPALSNNILYIEGKNLGSSLLDLSKVQISENILRFFMNKKNLFLPNDFLLSKSRNNNSKIYNLDYIYNNDFILSIGDNSLRYLKNILRDFDAIFINGIMGLSPIPESLINFKELLFYISKLDSYKFIAGSDTSDYIFSLNLDKYMDFISTGGGSTLYYLSYGFLPDIENLR